MNLCVRTSFTKNYIYMIRMGDPYGLGVYFKLKWNYGSAKNNPIMTRKIASIKNIQFGNPM